MVPGTVVPETVVPGVVDDTVVPETVVPGVVDDTVVDGAGVEVRIVVVIGSLLLELKGVTVVTDEDETISTLNVLLPWFPILSSWLSVSLMFVIVSIGILASDKNLISIIIDPLLKNIS